MSNEREEEEEKRHEEVEFEYMQMIRRGELEIGSMESTKFKKDNNAKDILNEKVHTKIT